jgi:adenine-specific DNA-methyltransferase
VPDTWFLDLFKIFEIYNFTIDESTTIDVDISVDPEMLGRIFENLLAEINPETGETARKSTGSYYTPRPIVEYMVDESLKQYFLTQTAPSLYPSHQGRGAKIIPSPSVGEASPIIPSPLAGEGKGEGEFFGENKISKLLSYSDEEVDLIEAEKDLIIDALDSVKIIDPACGSGAFPMGILHKMLLILQKIDPESKMWLSRKLTRIGNEILRKELEKKLKTENWDYIHKLGIIQNSIYGVDIQPIAVEISKLRFFLSLIVDERIDDSKPNRDIVPLPNLEFKFVAANSLIGLPKAESGLAESFKDIEILRQLREAYFTSYGNEKRDIEKRFLETQKRMFEHSLNWQTTSSQTYKLSEWNPFSDEASSWFDPEWMFGIKIPSPLAGEGTGEGGFDIVIANPPYIKEYTHRNAFDGLRESPYYQGKMDIWYLFACKYLDSLKNKAGVLTFIATNNWVTNSGASKFRNKIAKDAQILKLIDFGDYKIFETAGIQTMVIMFQRDKETDNYNFDYRRISGEKIVFEDILDLLNYRTNPANEYLKPKINRNKLINQMLTFSHSKIDVVFEKMLSNSNFYLNENEVANGIHHHHDFVNKERQKILGDTVNIGDGIFVLSDKEKKSIPFLKNELELIKPSYTTKELHKWYGNPKNKEWVIYTDSSFKDPKNIKPYPNIKAHLDKFKKVITSDNKPYGLHRARDEKFFKSEKIIAVRKCAEPTFTYIDFDCYVSATFYVIKSERIKMKYLTAILNSKLIAFWLKHKGKMQGNNYQIDKEPLLAVPIHNASIKEQQPFITLVDQILSAKQKDPDADISAIERQIDEMVYDLYSLTPDEIEIVEGKR